MRLKNVFTLFALLVLLAGTGIITSCDEMRIHEDLPACRLYIDFKYDYNMLSSDAFAAQVDKVELYVFDENGKYLFKQVEQGGVLATGDYRMPLQLPYGTYKLMAWAGAKASYDITPLTAGVSTINDLKLKLKRESLLIDKELEPLWYGEIKQIAYKGNREQQETINLIKDTNKVRFAIQGQTEAWQIDLNDYSFEIIESNGYLDYDNSLLEDDILSYQPYFKEQKNPSAVVVELNTMRLMADRKTRFTVTEKATGEAVFDINLIDFLAMTEMEGHRWGLQEYLDRQDEYVIVFFFADSADWNVVRININGWTWYKQTEGEGL